MQDALSTISEGGILGAIVVLCLLTIGYLFKTIQDMHRENRSLDQENLKQMFEAVRVLGEAKDFIARGPQK